MDGSVYLLHFSRPLAHARHYLGYAADGDADRRLQQHLRGEGSPLVRAAIAAGITVSLARVWPNGSRTLERQLKSWHRGGRHCPLCRRPRAGQQLRLFRLRSKPGAVHAAAPTPRRAA
jgi:hypothetical protein